MSKKKPGLMQRLFGSKKLQSFEAEEDDDVAALQAFQSHSVSRRHTVDVETFRGEMSDEALMSAASAKYRNAFEEGLGFGRPITRAASDSSSEKMAAGVAVVARRVAEESAARRVAVAGTKTAVTATAPPSTANRPPPHNAAAAVEQHPIHRQHQLHHQSSRQRRTGAYAMTPAAKAATGAPPPLPPKSHPPQTLPKPRQPRPASSPTPSAISLCSRGGGSFKRRVSRRDRKSSAKVDTSQPLAFPTTPETILEYHKAHPFLDENEEWLLVELNEYECLVDSLDIIKIIAKHSKFFEVEPDELWEEFFEFVDDVPSYDEVINFDVWQEFRDKKYTR